MPLNDDNLELLLDVLQSFMDENGLTDPEPEVTYMDNRAFVTIHLDELGPVSEDVDLLDLETRIGQLNELADVDVDIELIESHATKSAALMLDEDEDDDDINEGFRTFSVDDDPEDICVHDEAEDQDVEAVVKSFIEEEAVNNVVVYDDYEPTDDDIQDLYDRFDDASRFSEVEDMGDWD